ncbi:MAG: hypothetical protein ABIO79_11870 [Ferruginibacter sp.]
MNKLINLSIYFILFSIGNLQAQNVGINNPNPAEKLDVTGNINVTGTIKANGTAGQTGQILTTNNLGNLEWTDACNYSNRYLLKFTTTGGVQTWTVPAGVTKIAIEVWGGGGRGYVGNTTATFGGGGGGGGYIRGYFTVTTSSSVSIIVGGGGGNDAPGNNGDMSSAAVDGTYIRGYGGSAGGFAVGEGGIFEALSAFKNWFGIQGEHGKPNIVRYDQVSATDFARSWYLGSGGNAGNTMFTSGTGGFYSINTTTSTITYDVKGYFGSIPGGGGPASIDFSPNIGATGQVIIHY